MKRADLRILVFMALCCDLGLFSKRLVAPLANIVTDALHIPGGVGTSFSLMFLVVAAALAPGLCSATVMSAVQSVLALAFGMVGSMGALSVVGYVVPGVIIDLLTALTRRVSEQYSSVLINALSAAAAALTANLIVFRLSGIALGLYVSIALSSGALCGLLAGQIIRRVRPVLGMEARDRSAAA